MLSTCKKTMTTTIKPKEQLMNHMVCFFSQQILPACLTQGTKELLYKELLADY